MGGGVGSGLRAGIFVVLSVGSDFDGRVIGTESTDFGFGKEQRRCTGRKRIVVGAILGIKAVGGGVV